MTIVEKSLPLATLGLHDGDALLGFDIQRGKIVLRVVVREDLPPASAPEAGRPLFSERWGGAMRKIEDPADAWLTHINEKHVK